MYVCPRKWAWLFQFETFWKPLILPGKKRGLEAFRAFSCVFYISTSNVVQFGSITLTLKELLPPWQIRRPHLCIDVAPLSENRISKRVLFDIAIFENLKFPTSYMYHIGPKMLNLLLFTSPCLSSLIQF